MNFKEKKLYHQIHPVKLFVDISTGILTTYLLWKHNTFGFLVLFSLPSIIISLVIIKFGNLYVLKNSRLGKYIEQYMTPLIETIRISGQIIMWVAGWYHSFLFIIIGFLIIIGGWFNGVLFKRSG